jgi:hypothetical protein
MQTKWLVCVLLSSLAAAQANPGAPAPPPQTPPPAAAAPQPAEVKPTDPVLTITGYCPARTTASKTAAGAPAKPASAKAPADCKTVITRAQFEKLADGLAIAEFADEKEKGEAHSAVLGVVTRSEFIFSLGQIEGNPFDLSKSRDEKQDKRDRLHEDERTCALCICDFDEAERASQHDHWDKRKSHRHFIADHLSRTANSSKEAIF